MASFPDSVRAFRARRNRVDINDAEDVNDLQAELVAVQATLGRNPHESDVYPGTRTVADRLGTLEADVRPRVAGIEQRLRRAAVGVRRLSTLQLNSQAAWQPLVLPDVDAALTDFGVVTELYSTTDGVFRAVAPAPGLWVLSAAVTFAATADARGARGLAVAASADGTLLAATQLAAVSDLDQQVSVSWAGRLPESTTHGVRLLAWQNQGTAVSLRAHDALTPLRADFVHIPG